MLTGTGASPLGGAPGAVILYALAAVVLWPVRTPVARVLWFVLWASEAACALLPASRAPHGSSSIFAAAAGQPGPPVMGWVDARLASALAGHGLAFSVVLTVACGAIAVSGYLPSQFAGAGVILAVLVAALAGLAEGFGGIFTGTGTDPSSAPILTLLALAFWPRPAGPCRGAEA